MAHRKVISLDRCSVATGATCGFALRTQSPATSDQSVILMRLTIVEIFPKTWESFGKVLVDCPNEAFIVMARDVL